MHCPASRLPFRLLSQLQAALAAQVPSEAVHCSHPTVGYEEARADQGAGAGAGAADHVLVHFRGQPSVSAKLVVGADGVFSAVRAAMLPNDPGPR